MFTSPDFLNEVCLECGLTRGAHSASSYYSKHYNKHILFNACPGNQRWMNWNKSPGTVFAGSGIKAIVPAGTAAKNRKDT